MGVFANEFRRPFKRSVTFSTNTGTCHCVDVGRYLFSILGRMVGTQKVKPPLYIYIYIYIYMCVCVCVYLLILHLLRYLFVCLFTFYIMFINVFMFLLLILLSFNL
jgi:hypothetical protein